MTARIPAPMTRILRGVFVPAGARVVGGCLRDIVRDPTCTVHDVDVIVHESAASRLLAACRRLPHPFVVLDRSRRIYRIVCDRSGVGTIDVSVYGDLADDIARRDFTINTLHVGVEAFLYWVQRGDTARLLTHCADRYGGVRDLRRRILRVVAPTAFRDDPLRILRAARFMAAGYRPDRNTDRLAHRDARMASRIAAERVSMELRRLFELPSYEAVVWLDGTGALDTLLPEVCSMKRRGANTARRRFYFHEGGLWEHARLTLKSAEAVLRRFAVHFPRHHAQLDELVRPDLHLLKLAALLHDVEKPAVARRDGERVRFFHHEERSAHVAAAALRRLRFSAQEAGRCASLITHHMRIGNLCHSTGAGDRAFVRLFNDTGDVFPMLLVLSLADRYSYAEIPERAQELREREMPVFRRFVRRLAARWFAWREAACAPRLLSGEDVMRILNIPPGPTVGAVLRALDEERSVGTLRTRAQAERYVRAWGGRSAARDRSEVTAS